MLMQTILMGISRLKSVSKYPNNDKEINVKSLV
jgi:hypothetical protein